MKRTCILFLALAATACHSDKSKNDDRWSDSTTSSAQSVPQQSAGNYDANRPKSPPAVAGTTSAAMSESGARSVSADDRKFVTEASQGGMFEVKSSQLAIDKGVTGSTREFAQMMIDDHGKANRDLESIAKKKGVTTSSALDSEHQAMLDELNGLTGKEFERKYHDDQVKGHDAAIALFERYSKDADDADIKAFANRLLPTLRAHRKHLDEHPME
jgi:putative membrane protein